MDRFPLRMAAAAATLLVCLGTGAALAQKPGGVLKMPNFASPASMSIQEEITRAAVNALMPVFNNLVLFDQHKAQNTIDTCRGRRPRSSASTPANPGTATWTRSPPTATTKSPST